MRWKAGPRPSRLKAVRSYLPFIFLLIVLKIPVLAMLYLVFWAAKEEDVEDAFDEGNDEGGGGRKRPMPKYPIGPRRDPHGGGAKRLPKPAHDGRPRQPAVVVARSLERSRSADKVRK
jgi:hypothetical protein